MFPYPLSILHQHHVPSTHSFPLTIFFVRSFQKASFPTSPTTTRWFSRGDSSLRDSWSFDSVRPIRVHFAPSVAKRDAIALPMPPEAPVIMTCLIGVLSVTPDENDFLRDWWNRVPWRVITGRSIIINA